MPLDAMQEKDTAIRAQAGDKSAFEDLIIHYRPQVTGFAASILHDKWMAEDIAQECFAKLWLNLPYIKIKGSLKSWIFKIVRNRCIDYLRCKKSETSIPDDWELPDKQQTEMIIEQKELWQEFLQNYHKLDADAQTALYLFAAENMPYKDIAKVMGKNATQIKTLIYRARKKLKAERRPQYD